MKTIQTTIVVDAEHKATIQLPEDIAPGEHPITIIIPDTPPEAPEPWKGYPSHDIPWIWPEGYTFRREDMYGDDGR